MSRVSHQKITRVLTQVGLDSARKGKLYAKEHGFVIHSGRPFQAADADHTIIRWHPSSTERESCPDTVVRHLWLIHRALLVAGIPAKLRKNSKSGASFVYIPRELEEG